MTERQKEKTEWLQPIRGTGDPNQRKAPRSGPSRMDVCLRACKGIPTPALESGAIQDVVEAADALMFWCHRPAAQMLMGAESLLKNLDKALTKLKGETP